MCSSSTSGSDTCSNAATSGNIALQAARDQTAVTRAQVTDAERTLAFNVGQQFVSVLLAESTLQFALQDLKSFQQTVDIGESQFKAGYIGEGDYLKIKLQLLQFQTDVSSARLAKVQALVALRELLGYNAVPADFDVIGDLAYQPLKGNLEDLQAKALRERPDFRAAELGITAAQSQIQLAKANAKVDVNGTYDFTPRCGREHSARSLPILTCRSSIAIRARSRAPGTR